MAEIIQNKLSSRLRAVLGAAVLVTGLLAGAGPAAASPSDPASVDELRSSIVYRSDHADVLRLYWAFFNREPDIDGALYWMGVYDQGSTLDDLAWGFSNSTEFIRTYGTALSNLEFLQIVYGNVLGRTPDDGGLAYWLEQMDGGLSQYGVVRWVAANAEFSNRFPYADMSAQIESVLIGLPDLTTGWIENNIAERSVDDPGSCLSLFRFPDRASFTNFYRDSDFGPFLTSGAYSYPQTADAEGYMSRVRARLASDCVSWTDEDGWTTTYALMAFDQYGDDVLAVRTQLTHPDTDDVYDQDMVVIRYGSSLLAIALGGWFYSNPFETDRVASLMTDRLIELVGP